MIISLPRTPPSVRLSTASRSLCTLVYFPTVPSDTILPEEAVQAFIDLGADIMIPVHWGTFDLADEPLHEPIERVRTNVAEREIAARLVELKVGESVDLPVDDHFAAENAAVRSTKHRK